MFRPPKNDRIRIVDKAMRVITKPTRKDMGGETGFRRFFVSFDDLVLYFLVL